VPTCLAEAAEGLIHAESGTDRTAPTPEAGVERTCFCDQSGRKRTQFCAEWLVTPPAHRAYLFLRRTRFCEQPHRACRSTGAYLFLRAPRGMKFAMPYPFLRERKIASTNALHELPMFTCVYREPAQTPWPTLQICAEANRTRFCGRGGYT